MKRTFLIINLVLCMFVSLNDKQPSAEFIIVE